MKNITIVTTHGIFEFVGERLNLLEAPNQLIFKTDKNEILYFMKTKVVTIKESIHETF